MSDLYLIPAPQEVEIKEGNFTIRPDTLVYMPASTERPETLAGFRLIDTIEKETGYRLMVARVGHRGIDEAGAIVFEIADPPASDPMEADGYTLKISANNITLTGNAAPGLLYGIETLRQLVEQYGTELPNLEIKDFPEFQYRGLYFDISRGKVPRLETYKWLVDYIADHKINMLQLYVEHPFQFRFDPSISQGPDALTPEEVIELVEYCRDRRIDFVPSLASFGHMGGVLSLPQYRHLADVELEKDWDNMTWHERMKGGTINMNDPEALELLEKMHDDFLPLFESKFVNVCADETYDLGEGKNKEAAEKEGKTTLYLRHINWLNELCRKYDRRMMFWGDIIKQEPDRIPDIPKDTIPMNWGYWREFDYESSKAFADAGLDFFVVPGTSSWNRISNGIINADLNMRRHAETGRKYGAMGYLNTDWGDHGNYNMIGGSLHGFALGAAMAWNPDAPDVEEFDKAWNARTFGIDDGRGAASMREQSDDGSAYLVTWPLFYRTLDDEEFLKKLSTEQAQKLIRDGMEGVQVFTDYANKMSENQWIADEWAHLSRMNALLGEKYLLAVDLKAAKEDSSLATEELAARLNAFADTVDLMFREYAGYWMDRNKRTDLEKIEQMFSRLSAQARAEATAILRK